MCPECTLRVVRYTIGYLGLEEGVTVWSELELQRWAARTIMV